MKYFALLFCIAVMVLGTPNAAAQESDRDRGIQLYRAGKSADAVSMLERASGQQKFGSDPETFNYLGLAYLNADDVKKARKSLEKAVKLQPQNSIYRANLAYAYLLARQLNRSQEQAKKAVQIDPANVYAYYVLGTADLWEGKLDDALSSAEKIVVIDPHFSSAYVLKSEVLLAKLGKQVAGGSTVKESIVLLRQARDVLATAVENSQGDPGIKTAEAKFEAITAFYDYYNRDSTLNPTEPDPGVIPIKILSKPRATYTDNARQSGKSGSVRLAVLFGANGKIQHILKMSGVGYGLDEQAMKAARLIVFEPKMKDGKPVSSVLTIEYSFSIY